MYEERKINPDRRRLYQEKGCWSGKTLGDCWRESVRKYGDREYVADDRGFRYTYREMDNAAARIASFLIHAGVRPGEIVSFQVPIWSEFVMIAIACLKAGAVAHPVAMSYEERELVRAMTTTASKVYFGPVFFHKTDYEKRIRAVREKLPGLKEVVLLDYVKKPEKPALTLRQILETYEPLREEEPKAWAAEKGAESGGSAAGEAMRGEEIAVILGTSGTTGGSKGVLLSHDNIRFSEETFNRGLALTKEDVMFMPAPLHHATGFHHGIIAPMLLGAKVVLMQKYRCQEAIALMNREKCTYSMGATPFIYDILRELEANGGGIPSLRFYLCGGAPVPDYMVERARRFGICLCEVYGSTESVPHAYVRPGEAFRYHGTVSGRAMEGVEIRVVDEEGRDVPFGTPGEEWSRGPNVFLGYLKDRETTDQVLDDDGWFHSGDICRMDPDGNIRIIGRKKDMIVRGGENLNSNEINDNLEGCPGMGDHAVIGMPDERMGERICAFAVPKPGCEELNLTQVKDWLKSRGIPRRFWPERLELISRIPHTGSGKVKKYLLKEELEKRMKGEETDG